MIIYSKTREPFFYFALNCFATLLFFPCRSQIRAQGILNNKRFAGTSRIQPIDQENLTTFLNCSNDALNNPCFKPDQKENIQKWQEIIQTSFYRDSQQPRKPKPGRNNQMARNRNLSNRTASNRGSTRNLRIVLTSLNYRLDVKNFLSIENMRVKTLYRGNSHSHQRSVPNPMSFSNNWSLQNSFPQKSSQNFSPNTLSPPQVTVFKCMKWT